MSADPASTILGACMRCDRRFDQAAWDDRHTLDHPDAHRCDADPGDYHPDCCPLCAVPDTILLPGRFDVAVLARIVGATSAAHLATMAGVSVRTVWRWRASGLTALQADRVAVACGHHPGAVWPTWWQYPVAA